MYKCLSFSVLTDTHDNCEKDTEFDFSSIPMIIEEAPQSLQVYQGSDSNDSGNLDNNEANNSLKKGKKNNGKEYINGNPDGTFICTICNSVFTVLGNANRHFKTVHEKLKPFECTVCKRCFAAKQVLMRHYTKVHGVEQPKGIKSTNEEKVYVYESNNSIQRSLKKATKRLKFKTFSDATVHEEEIQVLCDLCNIIFSSQEQFRIHFETMHEGKNQDIKMADQGY